MSGSDSTPEKIMAPSRRAVSAGSVGKRNQILSDDEDESEIYNSPPEMIVTPSPSKRRSMSVGSVGKRLKILSDDEDETSNDSNWLSRKQSMSGGSVVKRCKILSDDEDETSNDLNCNSTLEMAPLPSRKQSKKKRKRHKIPSDDEDETSNNSNWLSRKQSMSGGSVVKRCKILSDDEDETSNDLNCNSTLEMAPLPSRKQSKKKRKRHKIPSNDEDETSNNSNCTFTPTCTCTLGRYRTRTSASNVKRSLSYGERTKKQEKNLLNTQSNVSLENENSTNHSYMSDSQEVDSESSDDSLSDFIVEDSEISQDSQDQAEVESMRQLVRKLSREEAHELYVQMVLASILENDHPLKKESDPLFEKAKKVIEDDLLSRKNLVDSSAWGDDFKDMLRKCSVLKNTTLSSFTDTNCQACKRDRCVTKLFSFYHESDGVKEFKIGCFCAAKGFLYHRIHHYCTVELKEACSIKLGELREEMVLSRELSVKDIVRRYCTKDDVKTWLDELFTDFKELLNQADDWAVDGKEHRKMMNAVSSYL